MTVVTGGRYNGKLEHVMQAYNVSRDQILDLQDHDPEEASSLMESYRVLYHLESYIRKSNEAGMDASGQIMEYADRHPECIIICDEVGSGVVPVSAEEDSWRETVGRIMCSLTKQAGGITRVTCGIAEKIPHGVSLSKAQYAIL